MISFAIHQKDTQHGLNFFWRFLFSGEFTRHYFDYPKIVQVNSLDFRISDIRDLR